MERDVFISYAHEDKAIADAICAKLEENKIRCWIAPRDITPGEKYAQALVSAIEASKLLVVVFSHNADKSPHVMTEIERAFNLEKIIIPFRIEDILPSDEFQYFIGRRHWLDALTPPLENHIAHLVQVTMKIIDNNPEPEKNKGISPSPDGEKTLRKFRVIPNRSQRLMYLGGIVLVAVIIMIIVFSGISFPPATHTPATQSSSSDGVGVNSSSLSPSSSITLTSTTPDSTFSSTSALSLIGNWSGYYETSEKGDMNECMYHSTGKLYWNISSAESDSFSGTVYITGIERRHSTTCQFLNTLDGTGTVQGKVMGNSLEGSYDYSNPTHYGGDYRIRKFTADLSRGKISGQSHKTTNDNRTGTFTLMK